MLFNDHTEFEHFYPFIIDITALSSILNENRKRSQWSNINKMATICCAEQHVIELDFAYQCHGSQTFGRIKFKHMQSIRYVQYYLIILHFKQKIKTKRVNIIIYEATTTVFPSLKERNSRTISLCGCHLIICLLKILIHSLYLRFQKALHQKH